MRRRIKLKTDNLTSHLCFEEGCFGTYPVISKHRFDIKKSSNLIANPQRLDFSQMTPDKFPLRKMPPNLRAFQKSFQIKR